MLSFAPNIRIFLHARPTDMRNYAGTVFMGSRPFPAQAGDVLKVPRTIG
jgi:hypothetical protein